MDLRIKGGQATKTCEWATTAWLGSCTATLIHPRVLIYAAHCGSRIRTVYFGEEKAKGGGISPKVKFCKTNPKYRGSGSLGKGEDYAFCVLEKPMENMPIAPIGYGCELEQLNPKNPVWLVGFGLNDNKEGRPKQGHKRWVKTTMNKRSKDGTEIEMGKLGFVSSSGDSGGPAYIKLTDGTWRTVGITSWGAGPGPNWYVSAAHAVPWIHKVLKQEGYDDIDITPCYDDDGTWAPSAECGGFGLDIGTAFGKYEEQCSVGAPLSGPSSICGDPHPDAKGGVKAPDVSIDSPQDGQEVVAGASLKVAVSLEDVPKGKEVEVTLYLSGKAQDTKDKAPYVWKLEDLAEGSYELVAKAEVKGLGSKSESKAITLKVVGDDPDDGDASDGDSDADGSQGTGSADDSGADKSGEKDKGDDDAGASGPAEDEDSANDEGASQDSGRSKGCSIPASGEGLGPASLLFAAILLGRRRNGRRKSL